MADATINEIAQKLNLSVDEVQKAPTVQKTFNQIKNNDNLTEEDKNAAYAEMENIYKGLLQSKKDYE